MIDSLRPHRGVPEGPTPGFSRSEFDAGSSVREGWSVHVSVQLQVIITAVLSTILIGSLGCGTTSGGAAERRTEAGPKHADVSMDGLVKSEFDGPGLLYLREEHGIGGYDAILIEPAAIQYRRGSRKLDTDVENLYLVSLKQALVDEADTLGVEIWDAPDKCAIAIRAGFVNVDITPQAGGKPLLSMAFVLEYRDSVSRQSLLRFSIAKRVERSTEGSSWQRKQIKKSFDRMIEEVNMAAILLNAQSVRPPPRPSCSGTLYTVNVPS